MSSAVNEKPCPSQRAAGSASDVEVLPPSDGPVLIVMTDVHMGNCVLSLPIIERLAAYFQTPVDLLIDTRYADLGERVPGLRNVLRYPSQAKKRRGIGQNLGPLAMMLKTTLKRYRLVFDFGGGTRQTVHTLSTLAPKRVALAGDNPWAYNLRIDPPPGLHAYEHYAHLLRAIGQPHPPPWSASMLRPPSDAQAQVSRWLSDTWPDPQRREASGPVVADREGEDGGIAVIHPSAGDAFRCWPPERFACVADQLVEQRSMRVVIIGSPAEGPLMEAVRRPMRHAERAVSATLPLVQLLALFQQAALLVSNESGPTHLASMTDLPIVTLFGPTRETLWRPYRRDRLKILRGANCDPRCGKRRCVLDLPCLRNTQVHDVIDAVDEVLETARRKTR